MKFKELESERLIFRRVKVEDTKILWDNFFYDYDEYKFYEFERIKDYAELKEKVINQVNKYDIGNYFRWAIIEKTTNQLIGNINLHHYNVEDSDIKLGYFIFKDYRNKGYASESVLKIIDFVFNDLKIHRITASAISENIASNTVLLKSGFILEEARKESHKIDEKYYDSNVYVLLNQYWEV